MADLIWMIPGLLIGIIVGVGLLDFIMRRNERKEELIEEEENNRRKRELCEYFIEQIKETKSLNSLLNIHKLAWALGLRNCNLGPNKYGMFRTHDIIKMTSQEVYLGNIHGLFTKTLADWSNNPKEEYQIVLEQYRRHLISNYTAIKLSL